MDADAVMECASRIVRLFVTISPVQRSLFGKLESVITPQKGLSRTQFAAAKTF